MSADRIVVLGAGQAGAWAALTLRAEGYGGEIALVGEEAQLPYERPPLSKGVLAGTAPASACAIVAPETYGEKRIVHIASRCTRIRPGQRDIVLADGSSLRYDRLIIATGSRPRQLPVAGASLGRTHYLRTLDDAAALRQDLLAARRLLVVGGGWIGLEVAATARAMGLDVTLAEPLPQLCRRSLAPPVAALLERMHRANGVDIRLNTAVARFEGGARIERVHFADGTAHDIDCAVIGIGVLANDELAKDAGIAADNGIIVDGFGGTSADGIFAAGDVARHPNSFLGGAVRLETWEHAQNHGIHVARAALGKAAEPYDEVPWVWSDQYDCNIQIMGFLPDETDVTVWRGDPESASFTCAYLRDGRLWGAVAFNQGRDLKVLRRLMQARTALTPEQLQLPVPQLLKLQAK